MTGRRGHRQAQRAEPVRTQAGGDFRKPRSEASGGAALCRLAARGPACGPLRRGPRGRVPQWVSLPRAAATPAADDEPAGHGQPPGAPAVLGMTKVAGSVEKQSSRRLLCSVTSESSRAAGCVRKSPAQPLLVHTHSLPRRRHPQQTVRGTHGDSAITPSRSCHRSLVAKASTL